MKAATVLLALLPGCATTATSAARRFEPADRAAIADLLETQRQAWNRGDLTAYMDGYARTPELVQEASLPGCHSGPPWAVLTSGGALRPAFGGWAPPEPPTSSMLFATIAASSDGIGNSRSGR